MYTKYTNEDIALATREVLNDLKYFEELKKYTYKPTSDWTWDTIQSRGFSIIQHFDFFLVLRLMLMDLTL